MGRRRGIAGLVGATLILCAFAVSTASARPATGSEPANVWIADGTVSSIAPTPSGVFVAGDFSLLGRATGAWVQVDPAGRPRAPRPLVDGAVTAATADGAGGWYLRGSDLNVAGVARRGVLHLKRTGALDASFHVASNGTIAAMARVGELLYIGGSFTAVNGETRAGVAAIDVRTMQVTSWAPKLENGKDSGDPSVDAIAATGDGATIYLGGEFVRVGRRPRAGIASFAADGHLLPFNPHPDSSVSALGLDVHHHVVYFAGDFTHVDGAERPSLAAVDATTGRLTKWNPDCDGTVNAIRVSPSGSPVYVAGEFASIGGKSRRGVAAIDAHRGVATPFDANVTGSVATMLLEPKRRTIVIGGEFSAVGDAPRSSLAAVNLGSGHATAWDPKVEGTVSFLAPDGTGVRVGGNFAALGASPRDGVAELDLAGSQLLPFAPELTGVVRTVVADPVHARVLVGGRFAFPGEKTQVSLATIDAAGTLAHWGPVANSGVWSIAPSADGSVVYLGGAFATLDAKARRRVGAVDANGALLKFNPGTNGTVRAIVPANDVVYLAGQFSTAAGETHRGLALVDGTSGASTGWDAGADDTVAAIALVGDTLYAAGDFESIGGKSRKNVAALDAASGSATKWDVSPDDAVRALAVTLDGADLIVGGDFTKIAGGRRDIAEFELATGLLTAWSPDAPFDLAALGFASNGSLFAGGDGVLAVYR
jgi:hypothetical protein